MRGPVLAFQPESVVTFSWEPRLTPGETGERSLRRAVFLRCSRMRP